jgi:hypothetical protein
MDIILLSMAGSNMLPVEELRYYADGKSSPGGECMEVKPGCWLYYERDVDRLLLGKLCFRGSEQDEVVARCRREVPEAASLGWMFSGSMEALTLAPADYMAIDKIEEWFNTNYSYCRFGLYRFR